MRILKLLPLLWVASVCFADTYTFYVVRGGADLFDGATDQNLMSRVYSDQAVIEIAIQAEGTSPTGTDWTYRLDYIQEWDDAGRPKLKGTRAVGTKFKTKESGDLVTYHFSDTRIERWVSISPPQSLLQPVFSSSETNSQIEIKKGESKVIGGVDAERLEGGSSRKLVRYFIIERK